MNYEESTQPAVLLFSGQGNPLIGMGSDLWDADTFAKHIWDCASDISGKDLRRLCNKGPMNRLIQTPVQQMAVTAINVTLFSLWRKRFSHVPVLGSCGHSVGEYSALYAAGVFTLETLFRIIHFRAQTMDLLSKTHKGSMLALKGISNSSLSDYLIQSEAELDISCDNTPLQQVIGGSGQALNAFTPLLLARGINPVKLGVSGAWHTRLMQQGVQPMRDFLARQPVAVPQHRVIMNVTAKAEEAPETVRENLALHLTHTVKWTETLSAFLRLKSRPLFVEMSNKSYLAQLFSDFPAGSAVPVLHCRKAIEDKETL